MRAATIRDGEVVVQEHPDPDPGAGEVLVRVHAAGLNAADLLQRKGAYPAPPGSPQDSKPSSPAARAETARSKPATSRTWP